MSREVEFVRLYGVFVDRCCNDSVDKPGLQVGCRGFEGEKGGFSGLCRRFGQFDFQLVVEAVYHVDFSGGTLFGRSNDVEVERRQIECFTMVGGHFGRAVHDRRTEFYDTGIGKRFQYHFISYAVDVAVGNTYFQFMFHVEFFYSEKCFPDYAKVVILRE